MALTRRSTQRVSGSIWPGFVDAMTALLLVLMFVLTIFMIVQFILRETITGQEDELNALAVEITSLAEALGLEQRRVADLEDEATVLNATIDDAEAQAQAQSTLIATLQSAVSSQQDELSAQSARITTFEAQVASLLAERDQARSSLAASEADNTRLVNEQEALQLAIAQARSEIDLQAEEARLAAARREALEALAADLRNQVDETEAALSAEEQARLTEAAAAEILRERLQGADAELTAMTLALEEQRRQAEETLTLLAAAQSAESDLTERLAAALAAEGSLEEDLAAIETELAQLRETARDEQALRDQLAAALAARQLAEDEAAQALSAAERRQALLATANSRLSEEEALSAESQRRVALLSEQVANLRQQLGSLQSLLDDANERDVASRVEIQALGSQLNVALARAAAEERRRAELEEAERIRLEEETRRLTEETVELEQFRSDFFGQLRAVLGDVDGVQVVGDRFLFSSEVLFESGSADLALGGEDQISRVAEIMGLVAGQIPDSIDWILRVDGHTDDIPISSDEFADNWELSQARALSVVQFLIDELEFPPQRLAATGFGEFRPVDDASTDVARARNRRIELKLTER